MVWISTVGHRSLVRLCTSDPLLPVPLLRHPYTEIKLLLEIEGLTIPIEERMNIERIVEEKEVLRYNKCLKILNDNLPKVKK